MFPNIIMVCNDILIVTWLMLKRNIYEIINTSLEKV